VICRLHALLKENLTLLVENKEMMPAEGVSHRKISAVGVLSTPQKIRIMI
tara:strand:+ start:449 stop:598 length:150 start_codon:yes stop_codon:yes gene_type:complete